MKILILILTLLLTLPLASAANRPLEPEIEITNNYIPPEMAKEAIEKINKSIPESQPKKKHFSFKDFSVTAFLWLGGIKFIHIVVSDADGAIVYQKKISLFAKNEGVFVKRFNDGVIIAYDQRVARTAGAAWIWDELLYLDYFTKHKESTITVPGRMEMGGWGIPQAAHNFFMSQVPELKIKKNKLNVLYQFRAWKYTGDYKDNQFLTNVKPDIIDVKNMIIEINQDSELCISTDSTTNNGILHEWFWLDNSPRNKKPPWKEVIYC